MPKEGTPPKNNGIEPKYWHLIPTDPEFGSLTDYYGGRANASEEEREEREGRVDTLRETSIGLVEYHASKEGFNVLSERLGMGLFYEGDGRLVNVGIDVTNYLMSCSEKDFESMGGNDMVGFLRAIKNMDERLFVSFDFDQKIMAVVGIDKESGIGRNLFGVTDHDFSLSALAEVFYDDYVAYIGFVVVEDELNFGIIVKNVDIGETLPKKKMLMTRILTDCNFKTYLESSSPEKYENLARRIFFLDD